MGKLSYPQYENITFTPTEIVARSPNCLKRFRSGDVYGVRFNEAADSDAIFKATANIPGVQKLDFSKSRKLTEKSLATLRLFKNLKVFVGSESGSDGEALACVNNFMDIDQLYLPHATKLVAILNKIKSSKKLTRLGLGPCNMSTADFQAVADQSRLTYLDLYGNHVTSHDLAVLSSLRNLTELKLQDAGLDASALQTIKNFKSLTFLGLSRNRLSQNGLASLLELRHLTGLALEGTGIGAANIEILKQFKSLKELRINSPLLKPGDIEKIKGALPGVNVK
jgi:Leucine-rich repeat (LRR) protein